MQLDHRLLLSETEKFSTFRYSCGSKSIIFIAISKPLNLGVSKPLASLLVITIKWKLKFLTKTLKSILIMFLALYGAKNIIFGMFRFSFIFMHYIAFHHFIFIEFRTSAFNLCLYSLLIAELSYECCSPLPRVP